LQYLQDKAPAQYLTALTPHYPLGCKRVALDAGWLDSLHQPHVHLTDSSIVRINKDGLVTADNKQHDFDVIIFATVRSWLASG
jgi:cation diffusion facilitator CzcD-associated flavoprotein CzcO